uniref:DNA methyltransferase 1-associated protein 1 n=1 Tax=Eptatretus burgeri TaxID=7764 RepID=A0A8C4R863_EPTBU
MALGADVRAILELGGSNEGVGPITKKDLLCDKKKSKKLVETPTFKRPEGMHREVYALLYTRDAPPLLPSDSTRGYRTAKARLGCRRVRPWHWVPFTNPARSDGALLHHWRRVCDENQPYPFARFNKTVDIPSYSEHEYQTLLQNESWSRAETDYLWDLCRQFDLRWIVIHDRYDTRRFGKRSLEDLKERYYMVSAKLARARGPGGERGPLSVPFDADHERRRKEQLERLFSRTPEQVTEEENLLTELRRIEARRRERERATADLHKLMTAADGAAGNAAGLRVSVGSAGSAGGVGSGQAGGGSGERRTAKKKVPQRREHGDRGGVPETTGIRFPDFKAAGVMLRSQRMRLPSSVGQKKVKVIEQVLTELGIDLIPMPTETIVTQFNELRSDLLLLYELRQAHATVEYDRHALQLRRDSLAAHMHPPPAETGAQTSTADEAASNYGVLPDGGSAEGSSASRKRREQPNVFTCPAAVKKKKI